MLFTMRHPARTAWTLTLALLPSLTSDVHAQVPASRVVSLVPAATELIEAMGATHLLVGVGRDDDAATTTGLPRLGGPADPSIERILALQPDLVVTWRSITGARAIRHLRDAGARVYEARLETFVDVERTARDLGRALGRPAAGDSVGDYIRQALDSLESQPRDSRPSVLLVLHPESPVLTAGSDTYLSELVAAAGGRNVFSDATDSWPRVTSESVLARRPDVVVFAEEDLTDGLLTRLPWRGLRAVRDGRVMTVPRASLVRPGPASLTMARKLAHFLATVGGGPE